MSAVENVTNVDRYVYSSNAVNSLRLWNAETAGERLLQVIEEIKNGNHSPEIFFEGPMRKA